MLFIVFSDDYKYGDVFGSLNAKDFSFEGNDLLVITKDLKSYLLNICQKNIPSDIYTKARFVFINDIKISSHPQINYFLNKIRDLFDEFLILYHRNGYYTDQEETINSCLGQKIDSEIYQSHLSNSLYYVQIPMIAEAVYKQDISQFNMALKYVYQGFIDVEKQKIERILLHKSFKKRVVSDDISSFMRSHVIRDYKCMVKELLDLSDKSNGMEISNVINKYIR